MPQIQYAFVKMRTPPFIQDISPAAGFQVVHNRGVPINIVHFSMDLP